MKSAWVAITIVLVIALYYALKLIARVQWDREIDRRRAPLIRAVDAGDIQAVRRLLLAGADADTMEQIYTPMLMLPFVSVSRRMYKIQGAVVTALMLAAKRGRADIVEALLLAGADVNFRSSLPHLVGATEIVLGFGVGGGNPHVVRLLLDHGADPNGQTVFGQFPIIDAAAAGNLTIIDLLLAAGANIDIQSEDGDTALITAVWCDSVSEPVVRKLLEAGANVNLTNKEGKRAIDIAAEGGHHNIVKLLEEYGERG